MSGLTIDDADEEHEPIVISATIEETTAKALKVLNHDANETQWVPRVCVTGGDMMEEDEDFDDLELAYWKAEELGWA